MIVKIFRAKPEQTTITSLNKMINVDLYEFKSMELEFEDGSVLIFKSPEVYLKISNEYLKPINNIFHFDLNKFDKKYLIDRDDVNDDYYRNRKVSELFTYSVDNPDNIEVCRLKF